MDDITGDVRDFDFLVGTWLVANRRLKARLAGSTEWEEFPADLRCEARLGGVANVDEFVFRTKGFSGMTVRVFDLARRRWSIYWADSVRGILTPPVHGGFSGDRGEFYGDDTHDGRPVRVRFLWTRHGRDAAGWEQSFSLDGSAWERNWVMTLARMAG